MIVNGGSILLRNFAPDRPHRWALLNASGKWQPGSELAARFIMNGEDILPFEAGALAAKLGSNLAGSSLMCPPRKPKK